MPKKPAPKKGSRPPAGFIVTPGASATRDHVTLVALDDGLPEVAVERLTLGTTSIKRAASVIVEAAAALAERLSVEPDQIALGGRSFGGRSCSLAHADGLEAHSLILLSYPLHPPGKPEKLRVDHFPQITAPTFFLSGEKDPFGSPIEFGAHLPSIPGPVTVEWLPGNHSPKNKEPEIVSAVRAFWGL